MNGLILAGGNSTRMGSDKALLQYTSWPQYKVAERLLLPNCEQVYINSNNEYNFELPIIKDNIKFKGIGPIAALLSAFAFEKTDWFIVGVDYPFLDEAHLQMLNKVFIKTKSTCAFYHEAVQKYEPFIAIVNCNDEPVLQNLFMENDYSLQSFYKSVAATRVKALDEQVIKSINTLDEFNLIRRNGIRNS
jgi:molybdenum cofactor guanylyltransferase